MEDRFTFYQCLAGLGTALVVFVISSLALWQKPLFWESVVWQSIVFACLFALGNAWREKYQQSTGVIALWLMLGAIFILSWRVPVDIYFIYTIIWVAYSPHFRSHRECWLWLVLINVAWYAVKIFFGMKPKRWLKRY